MAMTTIPSLLPQNYGGEVTWHDLFCGAGGSSLGLHHVPGFKVIAALNHWNLAVMAHAANFPDTDHEVTAIEKVHPSRFRRARCGWFSPSCTAQAYCGPRGTDEESVRSRATMLDVLRWVEYHRYDVVVVENVIETKLWCDDPGHIKRWIDPKTGKEMTKGCSCGKTYDAWMESMNKLGMIGREVYFNSQHALVPQSRDRLYIVFTRIGVPKPDLDFTPPCYCSTCDTAVAGVQTWKRPTKGSARDTPRLIEWGRYGTQYLYLCPTCEVATAPGVLGSWTIIDRSLPIETIGSRKTPIVAATRKRIRVGMQRIGRQIPIQVQVGGNLFERPGYARVWSLEDPLRTITATPYMAAVIPNRTSNLGASIEAPMGTITTAQSNQMLVSLRDGMDGRNVGMPAPSFSTRSDQALVNMRNHGGVEVSGIPAQTVAASGNHHGLLVYNGNPGFVRVMDDAAGTVTARDKQSLLVPYNRTGLPKPVGEPSPTITAAETCSLLDVTDDDIDEMYFRMLQWHELQRGQAMHIKPDGTPYLLTARVRTTKGTYKELSGEQRVKLIGNAVSSPVAAMLGHSIAQALAVAA